MARLKRLPVGITGTAEIAGIIDKADFANIGDCYWRLLRLPILPSWQAKNGRLHADIENVAVRGCLDCTDCRY